MLCKTLITIRLLVYLSCFQIVECAAPSFTVPISSTSPGSVDENSAKDVSILTVEGQDTDGDTLIFSLVSQTPTSPPFLLDATSGLLKTPAGLDAEFSLTYNFTFGVSDGTTTVNSVTFTVNINDINEFTPVFQGTPYSASLLNSVSNGYLVFTAGATDADVTATITYSLTSGNDPDTFSLDSVNGLINVSDITQLDPTSTPSYRLLIQASDGTNTVNVTVSITVNASGTDEPKNNTGLTVGVTIAVVVVVLLLIGLAVYNRKKIKCLSTRKISCSSQPIDQHHPKRSATEETDIIRENKILPTDTTSTNTSEKKLLCTYRICCFSHHPKRPATEVTDIIRENSMPPTDTTSTNTSGKKLSYNNRIMEGKKTGKDYQNYEIPCSPEPINQHNPRTPPTEETVTIYENSMPPTDTKSRKRRKKKKISQKIDNRSSTDPPNDLNNQIGLNSNIEINWNTERKTTGDNYQNNEISYSPEPINQNNRRTPPTEETVTICEISMPPTDTKSKKRCRKKRVSAKIDNRSSTDTPTDLNNQFIDFNSNIEI